MKIEIAGLLILLLVSCENRRPQTSPQPTPKSQTISVSVPTFDREQAFRYLLSQTDFGPRNAGSKGHQDCLKFLKEEMNKYADVVTLQEFSHTLSSGERFQLTNVISSFNLKATDRILLTAHWDTRPWADEDRNPANRNKPILGANDGASGIAVLLEIARQVKRQPPSIGVDMIFFDGEDLGKHGDAEHYSTGSKYFARNKPEGFNPRFGINIDMIGDKELEITREPNSMEYAPDVVNLIFSTARLLNVYQFVDREGRQTYDDHIPLNEAKIRTADLIDFDYPDSSNRYWHTLEDTPDKCSASSLEAVGVVLLNIVYGNLSPL